MATETTLQVDHYTSEAGAVYVHKDLFEQEGIPAIHDQLGDIQSWASYVKRYCLEDPLLLWSESGLHAIADPALGERRWQALMPFVKSTQWQQWAAFANGTAWSQKQAVEQLEGLTEDVLEPSGADLLGLLRALRGTANASAETEIRPDGTASVRFQSDQIVRVAGQLVGELLELPAELVIAIPVLRGDTTRVKIIVRLRVNVGNDAHLALRFVLQNADRVLEAVYAERVAEAQQLVGDFPILRGAPA